MKVDSRIDGIDPGRAIDAIFVNSPLKDYDRQPRLNDFTLPVLGLGYLATYAQTDFNVGVLDTEAHGIGLGVAAGIINDARPRWVGMNLLAPTYEHSVTLLRQIDDTVRVMLGGHQAKAMPHEILADRRIPRIDALVLGEADTRASALLGDDSAREHLPGVLWRSGTGRLKASDASRPAGHWLAPNLDELPILERRFLADDPFRASDGRLESAVVGSRGCPYDCSFCGAARSANQGESWRMRSGANILAELEALRTLHGVDAVRFVDDLFLAHPRFMRSCLGLFEEANVADSFVWDATGRINVLSRADDALLDQMVRAGCREVALGVESGSERLLKYMGKRITPAMTELAVERLTRRGIHVKGYFILGFPTETAQELQATERHVHRLWQIADSGPGNFRASAFEFRPYPGTPEWHRLIADGRYTPDQLMAYEHIDLATHGANDAMRERDEFNFSVGIQFGETSVRAVREALVRITVAQRERKVAVP